MDPRFDSAYTGTPPWDIGRPQKEIVRLVRAGEIQGEVYILTDGTTAKVFAMGAEGTADAPWIQPEGTFEFRLYEYPGQQRLLKSVKVVGVKMPASTEGRV